MKTPFLPLVATLVLGCYAVPGARPPRVALEPVAPSTVSLPRPEPVAGTEDPPVIMPPPVAGPGDVEAPPGDPEVVEGEEPEPPEDVETLWAEVTAAADSLAVKRWQIRFAKENFSKTPKNEQAIKNMEKHHDAVVVDEFCPAATKFRTAASLRAYNKRASMHCQTAAPVAAGLAGKQVTLTAECLAAFATKC